MPQSRPFSGGDRRVVEIRPDGADGEVSGKAAEEFRDDADGAEQGTPALVVRDGRDRAITAKDEVAEPDRNHGKAAELRDIRGERPRAGEPQRHVVKKLRMHFFERTVHVVQPRPVSDHEPEDEQSDSPSHVLASECGRREFPTISHVLPLTFSTVISSPYGLPSLHDAIGANPSARPAAEISATLNGGTTRGRVTVAGDAHVRQPEGSGRRRPAPIAGSPYTIAEPAAPPNSAKTPPAGRCTNCRVRTSKSSPAQSRVRTAASCSPARRNPGGGYTRSTCRGSVSKSHKKVRR